MTKNEEKTSSFESLLSSVYQCDLCPRMCNRQKVLSQKNGNINTRVLFIAEAPGRLGAERTGIPLHGDKSGDNFETLLGNIGWKREDVFITNAVLCNPQDEAGNNSPPNRDEVLNCNYFLQLLLSIIEPSVVVTLGAKALEALNLISPHSITLKNDVATVKEWNGTLIFPLYHTSFRAAVHRSLPKQRSDFIALSHLVDPLKGLKKKTTMQKRAATTSESTYSPFLDLINEIMVCLHQVSFFKLTKLLYLIDLSYFEQWGHTISGKAYLRMQEGPWLPSLWDTINLFNGQLFSVRYNNKKPSVFAINHDYTSRNLSNDQIELIHKLCGQYQTYTDFEIKQAVYLTKPMRYILRQEKTGRKMVNVVILNRDYTVEAAEKPKDC